jgi:hypothetical protein
VGHSDARRRPRLGLLLLVLAVAVAVLAAGCGDAPGSKGSISASGKRLTKTYDLSGYSAVSLDSGVQAAVVRDDKYAVVVTLDDNLVEHLVAQVDGDTLRIGLDPAYRYSGQSLRATVTMPTMTGLSASGAAFARVLGFTSDGSLDVALSGGSRITFSGVAAGDVSVDASGNSGLAGELKAASLAGTISGASRLGVTGSASSAKLEGSGASNFDLPGFVVQDADVSLSGGSQGTVNVTGKLDADVSGGSTLRYLGSPALGDIATSGGGEVGQADR